MKTKTIPFDLETAKKIQAGEIKGKIICNKKGAEILTCNLYFKGETYLCVKWVNNLGNFRIDLFNEYGERADNHAFHKLVLEVPYNEQKFKPFDKVLVTQDCWHYWIPSLYRNEAPDGKHICIDNLEYDKCIPYEGNEHLLGTTDKPIF